MAELARTARLDVLVEGYVRRPHVAGTLVVPGHGAPFRPGSATPR